MTLNERKLRIIEAIINDYIYSAEPISSRTISKKYDLGISPATIRNEMSDLEEMGFLAQTHAMSGRIPSDKAYRLYVDTIVRRRELTKSEADYLEMTIQGNISQIDFLMKETAKAIAYLTNYTTIVSDPKAADAKTVEPKIKVIRLMPLDDMQALLVLIYDTKAVKNAYVLTDRTVPAAVLDKLSEVLSKVLCGLTLKQIDLRVAENLRKSFGDDADLLESVLQALFGLMEHGGDARIYTSGIKNLLSFPEFNDITKARDIFEALEEREQLITIMASDSDDIVEITIGSENEHENMKRCSIIKAKYNINDTTGQIGIIGPTRMDYNKAMSILKGAAEKINGIVGRGLNFRKREDE